jgi:hypothetical protein
VKIIMALLSVPCLLQPFGWAQDKASRAEDAGGNWALSFEELVALSSQAKPSEEGTSRDVALEMNGSVTNMMLPGNSLATLTWL